MKKTPVMFVVLFAVVLVLTLCEVIRIMYETKPALSTLAVILGALVASVALWWNARFNLSEHCLEDAVALYEEVDRHMKQDLAAMSWEDLQSSVILQAQLLSLAEHLRKNSLIWQHQLLLNVHELRFRIEFGRQLLHWDEKIAHCILGEWKAAFLKGGRDDKLEKALSLWLAFAIWGNSEALEHLDKELWQNADHFNINNIPKSANLIWRAIRDINTARLAMPPKP